MCVCVCHVQACPNALPQSLLPHNVYDVPSLPPSNLPFPVEHWCVRGRTGVYTHSQAERGRSIEIVGALDGGDIQFDEDQSRCVLCPVGHILLRELSRRDTGRPASG